MSQTPETQGWLSQLSKEEQRRIGVIVDAVHDFPAFDKPGPIFLGGKVNREDQLINHVLIAVEAAGEDIADLLTHVRGALDKAQLPSVFGATINTIAQPHFLGPNEKSTSGKPIYIAVGRDAVSRNVNELKTTII